MKERGRREEFQGKKGGGNFFSAIAIFSDLLNANLTSEFRSKVNYYILEFIFQGSFVPVRRVIPDRTFHNFRASKSVDSELPTIIKFVDVRVLRLLNCERIGRVLVNIGTQLAESCLTNLASWDSLKIGS